MNEKILIPLSILISGLLIGIGIYFSAPPENNNNNNNKINILEKKEIKKEIKKVDSTSENIIGDKNAEIFIIEYSDLECPFCKKYHDEVADRLIEKYKGKKVGFVFRHFPLTSIHPSSFGQAVASECASEQGGSEKFFEYTKKIFDETKSDGNFDNNRLPKIAEQIGLNKDTFNECLKDEAISAKVQDSYNEAIAVGLNGTPSVFAQLKSGQSYPIPADFEVIDSSLSAFMKELEKK